MKKSIFCGKKEQKPRETYSFDNMLYDLWNNVYALHVYLSLYYMMIIEWRNEHIISIWRY
jgi:hypothetical protein